MKKNKLFAPFLMLFAGAVVSIVMYIKQYSMKQMLIILLCVLIAFYLIGCLIQKKVVSFMQQIKEKEEAEKAEKAQIEGEVIEKELSDEEGSHETGEKTNQEEE